MKLQFTGQFTHAPRDLIRRCGYGEKRTREGKVSYTKMLRGMPFPRFHVYLDEHENGFQVNLHLDQKAPTYGKHTAHSGEYDGPVVEAEGERIKRMIGVMKK
jgi:hypothetical protein